MNTVEIDSNIYKDVEHYAKLHQTSVEEVVEKSLAMLLGKIVPKKELTTETDKFQKALAYVKNLAVGEGKPVPNDIDPMEVYVETKHKL